MAETYADVIDSWEISEDKKQGVSLTDYINRHNIEIVYPQKRANGGMMRVNYGYGTGDDEIEEIGEEDISTIELMKDQNIPYGEQVRGQGSGIMQVAGEDPHLIEEYQKHVIDMQDQGLQPMTFEQFKAEAMSGMASNINPEIRIEEVVKEFIRERGRKPNSLDELKEFYELRVGTASADPATDVVKELVEEDKTKITLASGGLAHILGV